MITKSSILYNTKEIQKEREEIPTEIPVWGDMLSRYTALCVLKALNVPYALIALNF